eukprot:1871953-Alexandrium_andersonii.AAC.1
MGPELIKGGLQEARGALECLIALGGVRPPIDVSYQHRSANTKTTHKEHRSALIAIPTKLPG